MTTIFIMGGEGGGRGEGRGPKGWGAPKGGALKGGPPKISLFFFPLPTQFSFLLPSLGGPFVGFWRCSKRRDPERCTFGGCVKRQRPQSLLWFTRQPESPNVHIGGSRPSKTPPIFHGKTHKRWKKERKLWRGREKKKERNVRRSGGGRSGGGRSGVRQMLLFEKEN